MWQPGPPATDLALAGAQLIVNISASPFHLLRDREREEMFRTRARDTASFVALCNTVGGQDELIFDGHSFVIDDEGTVLARACGFAEELLVVDIDPSSVVSRRLTDTRRRALAQDRGELGAVDVVHIGAPHSHDDTLEPTLTPFCDDLEQMRLALELGLGDYVRKNGFSEIVVGVSGGIDSALVAALAAEALGPERVHCVSMPSRYSSEGTRGDAQRLAENLGCDFREIAIEPMVEGFVSALAPSFEGREPDLTEENLQARIRGVLLMALSNKFGWLLVATGNKSEMSVGYATLYGDMAGGFALLKDVFKTDVFRLSKHLNERAGRELIPQTIIDRAPSAELRADQLDEDSLPPYPVLDRCSSPTSKRTARSRSSRATASTPTSSSAPCADRPRRVQAPAGAARRAAAAEGVRPRPADADHQPLAKLAVLVARSSGLVGRPSSSSSVNHRCSWQPSAARSSSGCGSNASTRTR